MTTLAVAGHLGFQTAELHSGNLIKTYKQCEATSRGLAAYNGGFLVTQEGKPLIFQYGTKETPLKKAVTAEKLQALAVSPCGQWLAAGSIAGHIYLWSLQSGSLLCSSEAHFKAVTCLKFTDDSAALVSGGADSRVLVWAVLDLVHASQDPATPRHSLTAHTLKVTGLHIGKGIVREARIFTASEDATVCVFNAWTGLLLHTLVLSEPICSMAVDPAERAVYAGTAAGIRVLPLYKISDHTKRLESIGSVGSLINYEQAKKFATSSPVLSLALSRDASVLFAGEKSGAVNAWDVSTGQLTQKFRPLKGGVSNLLLLTNTDEKPTELPTLQRMADDTLLDIVVQAKQIEPESFEVSEQDMLDCFDKNLSTPAHNDEAHEKLVHMTKSYNELKQLYDELWARHVKT